MSYSIIFLLGSPQFVYNLSLTKDLIYYISANPNSMGTL